MKKRKISLLFIIILTFMSGCFKAGDELLQAPKPSSDYLALQNKLDIELSNGSVYAPADSGSNRATIQLIDIDADAEEEAIAFFRESALSGTFNIVVYKKNENEYIDTGRITGHGNSIYSVEYPKLSPIGAGGLAVSWRISNQTERGLTVAKYENQTLQVVLDTQYSSYFIYDIDYDGLDEIFIINSENGQMSVSMYDMVGTDLKMTSKVLLSKEIETILRTTTGELASGTRAIAFDSRVFEGTGLITDIIALSDDGQLVNLSINEEDMSGMNNYRTVNTYTSTLNTQNVLYVPTLSQMRGSFSDNTNSLNWITTWHSYDVNNPIYSNLHTYHNTAEGWYYELNEQQKSNISISRLTASTIKITQFQFYLNERDFVSLFEIYTIPIDDYVESIFKDDYIKLGETTSNIYLAKNLKPQSTVRVSDEEIIENFNIISSSN